MQAILSQNLTIVKKVLDAGADIHARDQSQSNALMLASKVGVLSIVQCLIVYGADPNAVDKDGNNAANKAKEKGHVEILLYFRKMSILPNNDSEYSSILW